MKRVIGALAAVMAFAPTAAFANQQQTQKGWIPPSDQLLYSSPTSLSALEIQILSPMTDSFTAEQYLAIEIKTPNEIEILMNNIFSDIESSIWEDVPDDFSHQHNYYIYEDRTYIDSHINFS